MHTNQLFSLIREIFDRSTTSCFSQQFFFLSGIPHNEIKKNEFIVQLIVYTLDFVVQKF